MNFIKPYRFLLTSISIIVFLFIYRSYNAFPKDENLIRNRATISYVWKSEDLYHLRLQNERFGSFFALIKKDNLRGADYKNFFKIGKEIWIDVKINDFYIARYSKEFTFYVYGFGSNSETLSTVEAYNKNKKRRYLIEFFILLVLVIILDTIVRLGKHSDANLSKSIQTIVNNMKARITWVSSKKIDVRHLIIGMILISISIYFHLNDHQIFKISDLSSVKIVLSQKPEYYITTGKNPKKGINLKAYGYEKDFKITSITYKSVEHDKLKQLLTIGDTVSVWLPKKQLNKLREYEYVNNFNEIYGLVYESEHLIDFNNRNKLQANENILTKITCLIAGLVLLLYSILYSSVKPTAKI